MGRINPPEEIKAQLQTGEKLLWHGQPVQGLLLRKSDIFMIPFSLMWGGFAIFWEYMVIASSLGGDNAVNLMFPLFGIPFVLIGLYLIFGRFWADAKQRKKTFYGATSSRILIISGLLERKVKTLPLKALPEISLTLSKNGTGTILFGNDTPFASAWVWWPGMGQFATSSFDQINDAQRVYQIIYDAQKNEARAF